MIEKTVTSCFVFIHFFMHWAEINNAMNFIPFLHALKYTFGVKCVGCVA